MIPVDEALPLTVFGDLGRRAKAASDGRDASALAAVAYGGCGAYNGGTCSFGASPLSSPCVKAGSLTLRYVITYRTIEQRSNGEICRAECAQRVTRLPGRASQRQKSGQHAD